MASAAARYSPTSNISGDPLFQKCLDGAVEGLVPGQQGDDDRRIHAEYGAKDPQPVEQQQYSHACRI
jgi:hypothetical protein